MKRVLILFSVILFLSCGKNNPATQLENLNGYWEIRKVELAKDSVMEYGMSQYVDYIEITDSVGFRKKLQPKFGGGYIETNDAEKVTATIKNNKLILLYSTPYDNWKEEVIKADGEELVVMNPDRKVYHYRKYTPILTENDEKKEE
ncbi:lipocalin family protein [Gramella sp. KN1008]|uniref:lipocalin family protein n=1 Tax=Gramella sp. KN1008 TaxID=2529298 RepID=UPI00103A4A96|nr:lipocalin family protein [Gramella sp. KN1008]TBW28601.1 hypothetical protein EZJ28_07645 [Gramella sp. KN1008]